MYPNFKFRFLAFVTIFSMLLGALGVPMQQAHAAPAGTALQFNGSNEYVTFGNTRMTPGTLTGGPTWNTSANSRLGASSLTFNGTNQYVTMGAAPDLGATNFTLETWFYWTGAGGTTTTSGAGGGGLTAGAIPLVTKGRGEADGTTVDLNYFLGIQGGKLAADFEEGVGGPGPLGLNHAIIGSTTITTNTWHHAAVTYDSVNAVWYLYLDGVQDGTLDIGSNIPPRSDSIQHAAIGSALTSTGAAAGFFAGRIDEARIWNVVRTPAEIAASMNSEILVPTTGLLGRWGLNDASTSTTASNLNRLGVTSFTLEAWVKRDAGGVVMSTGTNGFDNAGGRPNIYPVVTKGMGEGETPANLNTNYFLGITSTGFVGADFEDTATGGNHPAWGTTSIPVGEWHHIAATYTGSCWALYVDGISDTLDALATACPNATPESTSYQHPGLAAGLNSTGGLGAGYFAGTIDEARVWNRALLPIEIQTNKNLELTSGSGLLARWGINEGSGATIASSVGTFNGNLLNTPTWVSGFPMADSDPPAAPTNLSATAGSASVSFTWTANGESDLAGYNLYRGTTIGGQYTKVNVALITGTSHTDTGLTNGTPYFYVLRAVDSSNNESGNSNEATATPTETATALDFDGTNDYVTFGDAGALDISQFTLETWFRRDGTGVTTTTGTGGIPAAIPLISNGAQEAENTNADVNYILCIDSATNKLCADFEEGAAGTTPGLNHPVYGTTVIQNGVWYHAAVTYDGSRWRLYLNGNLEADLVVGQPANAANISPNALATSLNTSGVTNGFFNGVMDEVRIWNVVRTQAEIMAAINQEINSGTGLIARWGMGEGSGSTINSSLGTFPGTLTNGPTWVPGAPFNITPPPPPAAPTLLAATATAGLQIDLTWQDNSNNETGFKVERSPDGTEGWTEIATTLANVAAYSNVGLNPGTFYCYRVRAYNVTGDSDYSNISCATTPGEANNALNFGTGTAYVGFGDPAALDLPQFTIETWFKRTGAGTFNTTGNSGIPNAIPLVTHGAPESEAGTVDANWVLVIDDATDVIAADFEDMASGLNHPVLGTTPITDNVWHHAAATYDGTTWRLYLDGNLEATLLVNAAPRSDSTQQSGLGAMFKTDGTALGHFDGSLDEVRVWNYARSQAQIQGTINSAVTFPQTGLVARWGLNEPSGTTVSSNAGTSVNGSITGTGSAWVTGSASIVNHEPEFVSGTPADLAADISTPVTLTATVSDPDLDDLTVQFYGRSKAPAAPGPDFTIIALPDTQYYTGNLNGGTPAIFNSQTQWIVNNKTASNIVFVTQLGDCTEHGDNGGNPIEWQRADTAFQIIENPLTTGLADGMPFGIAPGNHDQTPIGTPSGTTSYNAYFGEARFLGRNYYGGHYGADNDNHYELFSASGMDFIVIHLEYDTSANAAVLAWADGLLKTHNTRRAIVVTHWMINGGSNASFSSQGQAIYTELKDNPNLFLLLGGHVPSPAEGSRSDTYLGNTVYSLMSDYQGRTNGGNGWLRIMTFSPVNNTVSVKTYSPWLSQFETDADSQFTLNYSMSAAPADFELIGTDTVSNGGTASVEWNGLNADADYEWYVTISDATTTTTSPARSFTTAVSNQTPVITEGASTNVSMSEDGSPTPFALTLHATDADAGDTLTWSLTTPASNGTASVSGTGTSQVVSYTPTANYNGPDSFVVQVSDGNGGADSITVNVTVQSVNDLPTANPQNVTTDKNVAKSITLTGSDLETAPASLTFNIGTPPAHGTLTGTAPDLTYTPTTNYSGSDSFTFTVNDGTDNSAPATVSITINATNVAPVLGAIGNKSVNEGVLLSFTAAATDGDANPLTYSLDGGNPAGSSINSTTGEFTWTPTESQGGSAYPITIRVSDGVLEDFETITVTVNEVNQNPQVTNPGAQIDAEGSVISLQINATDADLPANTLAYSASNLPTGLSISPTTGLISGTVDFSASASSPYSSSVTVSDGQGGSVPVNFTWSILEAAPPPSGLTCSIIQPKPVTASTGEKPQSKVWNHDGNWYAIFPTTASGASSAGTWLWKLEGTAWTEVLKLSDRTDVKADAKVLSSVVHVLLYAGTNTQLVSAEFSGGTYQLWTSRPTPSPLSLTGSEIATIELDSTGRLWLTTENDATDQIVAYYSDSPYSSWSGPVVIASGVADDDISTIVAMPNNKIGIFCSNQNTQRFGFKVHNDADAASVWSADEVPASQSALNIGLGMSDDHLNLKVASDGTLYAGVKTSYDTAGYPKIAMLVRRPAGTWDDLYGLDEAGTRGILMLDETNGYLTYIYTSSENYNPIVYKQSTLQTINFGSRVTLRSGSFNDASSMKENYNGEFVVLYSSSTDVAGQLCVATPASGADLSITKTDANATVRPNENIAYTITVTNNGPQAVIGATVTDVLPSALTNASWVCAAGGGAGCAASGSGNINDTVNLPVGGSVAYTLSAKVDLGARGTVVNTATVTLPGGVSDPLLSNNTSTDTDTIIVSAAACEADSSLVGCWQMEENGGAALIDGSAYMNDAALSGTPAWAAGKVGSYAFDFNGSTAYATAPDDASLDLTNQITVAAWIKPEVVATQDLIKKAINGGTNGFELSLATSTSTWPQKVFFRINQVANGDTYRVNSTTLYPVDGNTWMHVAATFDGANLKLYINGQLEATTPAAGQSIALNNLALSLGGQSDGQRKFTGGMDEARVYNRVLSLSEIQVLAGVAPLMVSKTGLGSGSVTSSPAGIDCGATCSYNFTSNTLVTLTATPTPGSTFTGWSGAGCTGTGACQVTMDAAKSMTANFDLAEYTLTVNKVGNGTVTKLPDQATYHYGDVVALTATPDAGWSFGGWSANVVSGSVTITANTIVTATFTQNEYTLTINKVGNGTVTKSPNQATYHSGDVVALTATPDAGWSFGSWSANVVGGSVTITANTTVTATFTQNEYTLTVNKVGNGTVTKSPDQATYHYGDVVALTATPDAGWSFGGWSANVISGSVTITANTIVMATFTQNEYTLTVNKVGNGTVTKSPDQASYHYGDVVALTATPDAGWSFGSWSANVVSGSVTITANTTVTATFTQNAYTLTVLSANGTVTKSPNQTTYHLGDMVQLTATPSASWNFIGWSGDVTNTLNPISFAITGNMTVTANYAQNEYTLTINKVGNGTVTKLPDQATYRSGDVVALTATPDAGWSFGSWSANVVSGSVTITANTIVTATFTQNEYTLTINKAGNGTVTKLPDQATYHYGDVVSLTATPDAGWSFGSWSANVVSGSVTITANTTVTATFTEKLTPTLNTTGGPFTYNGLAQAATVNGSVAGVVSNIRYNGSATVPVNVGTYAVTADFTPTNTAVYNSLTNAPAGSITINKAVLTVTAHSKSILVGSPDPAFTFGYSGFVNSETASVLTTAPTCSVSGSHTAAGTYDIVCSGGVDDNYSFTYVKGMLTVTAVNNPPTNISLTGSSLAENQVVGTLIGTFSTTDVDAGDTFTYSFCGGADDASFTINGNSLLSAVTFDYEAKTGYSICIRSTDSGGLSTTKTFAVTITNLVDTQTFADVPMTYWAWSYIERLYAAGVTGGCGVNPLIYCPEAPVTRAQMAVFLLKGVHGPSYAPPAVVSTGFSDVAADHWAAAWIAQLAAEGITSGCGNGMYCPENPVTRAQMAVFLLKAKHGSSYIPPAATGVFSDVPAGYWADRWIEQLALEVITSGCGPGIYCPEDDVTRAQMAIFLVKAFNLP